MEKHQTHNPQKEKKKGKGKGGRKKT